MPYAYQDNNASRKFAMANGGGKSRLVALIGLAASATLIGTVSTWEGLATDPYADKLAGGIMTVCYGDTRVEMRRYSKDECKELLGERLVDYAKPVLARNPELAGHPNQLAAAISLTYNIGETNYARSTVARRFTAGNWRGACDAFLMWNRAGGRVVKGLDNRRRFERDICLKGL